MVEKDFSPPLNDLGSLSLAWEKTWSSVRTYISDYVRNGEDRKEYMLHTLSASVGGFVVWLNMTLPWYPRIESCTKK